MKVALIGASGFVGKAILNELVSRNFTITAIGRDKSKIEQSDKVNIVEADVFDTKALTSILNNHDVVVSAYNPGWTNPNIYDDFKKGSKSILEATKASNTNRLIVIGGAGSLFINETTKLIETPEFPQEIIAGATAASEFLDDIKKEDSIDWTFFSPAIEMHQGTSGVRTGKYRTGLENPVFNEEGRCILSVEDVAVVIADEIEHKQFIKKRFTAAY